jgi:hypothetical protein
MNDLQSSPEPRIPGHELDRMLRRYFRAEMPEPWPTLQPPNHVLKPAGEASSLRGSRTAFRRQVARLVLAASLGFLFAGYLGLAGRFPQPVPRGTDLPQPVGPGPIGLHKPLLLDTPGGAKVLSWEQKVPDGELLLMQEISAPRNKR